MTQRLDYQKLSAQGVRAVGGVYLYVTNSGLPKTLLDLVFLRASQINGCAYCINSHARDLQKGGVPVEKIMLLQAWREAGDLFSAKEKAALQWAEEVTLDLRDPRLRRGLRRGVGRVPAQGGLRPHDRDRPDQPVQPPGDQPPTAAGELIV